MKHIVTKGDPSPKTPEDIKDGYCVEANTSDLIDLLQANIPNNYTRVTIHRWGWDNKWDIKGEYVIFDFDPKPHSLHPYCHNDIEDKLDEIVVALNKVVGLDRDHLTIIFTGRGYHVLVKTIYDINLKFLKDTKKSYKEICKKLDKELEGVEVDPIFPKWNVKTRIPGRHNEKNNKEVKLIQVAKNSYAKDFLTIRTPEENQQALKQNLISDSNRVLSECRFISTAKARILNYESWMAMLSNLVRLPNGEALAHEYSKADTRYTEQETSAKILEANNLDQPYSCSTIDTLWDGCKECPHYKNIKSPTTLGIVKHSALLRQRDKDGNIKLDLKNEAVAEALAKMPLVYTNLGHASNIERLAYFYRYPDTTYYQQISYLNVSQIIYRLIKDDYDSPLKNNNFNKQITEWVNMYPEKNVTGKFNPPELLNFPNCVLDLRQGTVTDTEAYFDYEMDYEYDSEAECPFFLEKFNEWMEGVEYQSETLLRYVGLGMLGIPNIKLENFLILIGLTANGKSKFMEAIELVLGTSNISSLPLHKLTCDRHVSLLMDKRFNLCDETSAEEGFRTEKRPDWDGLKQVISGNMVSANPKHEKPFDFKPNAKIILSANRIPKSIPDDNAIKRRLLMIKFPNNFEAKRDMTLTEKFEKERSGILNLFLSKGRQAIKENYDLCVDEKVINLSQGVAVNKVNEEYFFSEFIEFKGDVAMTGKDIYDAYEAFTYTENINSRFKKDKMKLCIGLANFMRLHGHDDRIQRTKNGNVYFCELKPIEQDFSY